MTVVLDADVLIGALDGSDSHHARARVLLRRWSRQHLTRFISIVNLTEVLVAPAVDQDRLWHAREAIAALGVATHQPTESIGVDAARLRRRYPISVPDAYCLATAKHIGASVVSFDDKVVRAARAERLATV